MPRASSRELYAKWFGEFDEKRATFFLWNTLASNDDGRIRSDST